MIGDFISQIIGCPSYNGALGARNMTEQERAARAQQMMGIKDAYGVVHTVELMDRLATAGRRSDPPLQIPDREPVPSLCCLNGRWL